MRLGVEYTLCVCCLVYWLGFLEVGWGAGERETSINCTGGVQTYEMVRGSASVGKEVGKASCV